MESWGKFFLYPQPPDPHLACGSVYYGTCTFSLWSIASMGSYMNVKNPSSPTRGHSRETAHHNPEASWPHRQPQYLQTF